MDTLDLNLIQLLLIISLFAILQSIVGIGLLLFGTPTLMLLGYTYDVVLSIILPASIVISALQVMENYSIVYGKKYLFVYTLPSIGLGLYYILGLKSYIDIFKSSTTAGSKARIVKEVIQTNLYTYNWNAYLFFNYNF